MTKTTRPLVTLAASALVAAVSATASVADVTMNFGWGTPMDNMYGAFAQKFKELAEEYTDGEVEVKLRPSGQIGGEDDGDVITLFTQRS